MWTFVLVHIHINFLSNVFHSHQFWVIVWFPELSNIMICNSCLARNEMSLGRIGRGYVTSIHVYYGQDYVHTGSGNTPHACIVCVSHTSTGSQILNKGKKICKFSLTNLTQLKKKKNLYKRFCYAKSFKCWSKSSCRWTYFLENNQKKLLNITGSFYLQRFHNNNKFVKITKWIKNDMNKYNKIIIANCYSKGLYLPLHLFRSTKHVINV